MPVDVRNIGSRAARCGLALLIVGTVGGCFRTKSNTQIHIRSVDAAGKPVPDAEVFINDRIFGFTDRQGNLAKSYSYYAPSTVRVSVHRKSQDYYFSPFQKNLTLEENPASTIKVEAVLYAVEKPSSEVALNSTSNQAADPENKPLVPASEKAIEPPAEASAAQVTAPASESGEGLGRDAQPTEVTKTAAVEPTADPAVELPIVLQSSSNPVQPPLTQRPGPRHPRPQTASMNVYTYSESGHIPGATVDAASANGRIVANCVSNARGRCVLKTVFIADEDLRLIVRAKDYLTQSRQIRFRARSKEKFYLKPGRSLDVFATQKSYSSDLPVAGAEVWINDEKVGVTDRMGHFTSPLAATNGGPIPVRIKAAGFIPEEFETDIVGAEAAVIRRNFGSARNEKPRVALAPVLFASPAVKLTSGQNQILNLIKKNLFRRELLSQRTIAALQRVGRTNGQSLDELLTSGWKGLGAEYDAVIQPLVYGTSTDQWLELRLIDAAGRIPVAAVGPIKSSEADVAAMDRQIAMITDQLNQIFPKEGNITQIKGDKLNLDFGAKAFSLGQIGDRYQVFGFVRMPKSQQFELKEKGTIEVTKVNSDSSEAKILSRADTAGMEAGDYVQKIIPMLELPEADSKSIEIAVHALTNRQPISGASVYWNDQWIGTSDDTGRLKAPKSASSGTVVVLAPGFAPYRALANTAANPTLEVSLERGHYPIRIETEPQGATILIGGKPVGASPVATAMEGNAGDVLELSIKAPPGYRDVVFDLPLGARGLYLSDGKAIVLERDLLTPALRLAESGNYAAAIEGLEKIDAEHSDHVAARIEAGMIYLNRLKQPENAVTLFDEVQKSPAFAYLDGQRQLTGLIYLGVAQLQSAEKMVGDQIPQKIAKLRVAIESFQAASGKIVALNESDRKSPERHLYYYAALARHRMFEAGETSDLAELRAAWDKFIQAAESEPVEDEAALTMLDNARAMLQMVQEKKSDLPNAH
jgi:hypothetical protein